MEAKLVLRQSPFFQSISLHAGLVLAFFLFSFVFNFFQRPRVENIPLEVIENPVVAPPTLSLKPPAAEKPVPPPPAPESRAVFGASRKSLTASDSESSAISVKQGNTVAKEEDNLKLEDSDADQLPIPADQFLVTSMPRLSVNPQIPYPPEARKAGLEGVVVMDLLIDETGRVRKVDLISGPGGGLDEAAVNYFSQARFVPAKIQDQAVPVRIRFRHRFELRF